MLEERRADVLRALVEEFILSGEPVSSRSILEGAGLHVSAATVRNDLAALEREGYVVQPHTSAGRLPTAEAYRFYVDHINPARLNAATQTRIAEFFSSVEREISRLLKKTSQLLAEITHYPAVVVGPPPRQETIRAVDLVQLSPQAVLVVTVTGSGHVVQEVCELAFELSEDELNEAERILKQTMVGQGSDASPRPSERVRRAATAAAAAVARAVDSEADVFVGGAPQMASAWNDLQVVQQVLEVLEREAPHVIITDINMPKLDGFGFIEGVRKTELYRAVPILVLTTESDAEKKMRARNAGATGWIVKPFDAVKLVEAVRRVAA